MNKPFFEDTRFLRRFDYNIRIRVRDDIIIIESPHFGIADLRVIRKDGFEVIRIDAKIDKDTKKPVAIIEVKLHKGDIER